jgi:hypothetical protein
VSTPLHATIAAGDLVTVGEALDSGCNPEVRALITGSQTLTSAQHAMVLGNADTWEKLVAQCGSDLSLITPAFDTPALYFADVDSQMCLHQ